MITLDGELPEDGAGAPHDAALRIETTTTVRAVAERPDHLPSRHVTHTYLFLDDVLTQPADPAGYPPVWQPSLQADYAMDPSVAGAEDLKASLRSLPTISLVMPVIDWFHPDTDPDTGGIYSNSTIARGRDWERVVSAEFFDFPHGRETQVLAGVRIYGNASRSTSRPKHNLRLVFRRELGARVLDFPVFGDEPEGINGLLLRGQNGDSWIHPNGAQRREALYVRDQFARAVHARMGADEVLQDHVHLYINGMYWGLYHTIERIEDNAMARRFGGFEEDWDIVKSSRNPNEMQVVAGSLDGWAQLQLLAAAAGSGEGELADLEEVLDLDAFADFLLVNFWNGNRDWDDNNFQAARRRDIDDQWRFFVWDSERTMLAANHDSTNKNLPDRATAIHHALLPLPEYRERFSARVALHISTGGALSTDALDSEFRAWTEAMREPLLAEAARWGDAHRAGSPYTPAAEWQTEVDRRIDSYIPSRTETLLGQLGAHGLW